MRNPVVETSSLVEINETEKQHSAPMLQAVSTLSGQKSEAKIFPTFYQYGQHSGSTSVVTNDTLRHLYNI